MHEAFYDAEVGILFLRFYGSVVGAQTQSATLKSVSELDSPSSVRGFFLDYRKVTTMDMTDSDRALFSGTVRKLLAMGLDIRDTTVAWVSDPTRPELAAVLARRNAGLAQQGANVGLTEGQFSLEEAFQSLGLPKDYRLPY